MTVEYTEIQNLYCQVFLTRDLLNFWQTQVFSPFSPHTATGYTRAQEGAVSQRTLLVLWRGPVTLGNGEQGSVRLCKAEQNRAQINSLNTAVILSH